MLSQLLNTISEKKREIANFLIIQPFLFNQFVQPPLWPKWKKTQKFLERKNPR